MSLEQTVWRIITPEVKPAAEIVATDDVIHRRVSEGKSPPTVVFYHWKPSVSIGKPQAISDLNLDACREYGLDIVRTPGGGRAVLHLGTKDISYSVIGPSNGLNHVQVYERFCGRIAEAIQYLGIPVTIDNKNDFYVNGGKISGNALRINEGVITQHGIILCEPHDPEMMLAIMNPALYGKQDLSELRGRLTSLKEVAPHIAIGDLVGALQEKLTEGRYQAGKLTAEEQREIVAETARYQDPNWFPGNSIRGLCWLSKGEERGSLRGN